MRQAPLVTFVLITLTFVAVNAHAQFSVLYNFGTNLGDPASSNYDCCGFGPIVQGRDGNLYSTSVAGGLRAGSHVGGDGTIFRFTPSGQLTVLYDFCPHPELNCPDGVAPGGLTLATDGNFYGVTGSDYYAQTTDYIFRITPDGVITDVFSAGGPDGFSFFAGPIQAANGKLYGPTLVGPNGFLDQCDGIYRMTLTGAMTIIYSFPGGLVGCGGTIALQGKDGNFYGEAGGGVNGCGLVFKLTPSGTFTDLHDFVWMNAQGLQPYSLIQANDGNFYGTSGCSPDAGGGGIVFKMSAKGTYALLHEMNPTSDGAPPVAMLLASDGNFYGVNNTNGGGNGYGTIFQITPQGQLSVLYVFQLQPGCGNGYFPDGYFPVALVQHTNGILYGITAFGGACNLPFPGSGVFFSFNLGLPQFVNLLPYAGKVGKSIEFLGQGFSGASSVSFNGVPASFTVVSDTYLTAAVPTGATTGFVTVTTSGGTLSSINKFRVLR